MSRERISPLPLCEEFCRDVFGAVVDCMTQHAHGARFDHGRPAAGPRPIECLDAGFEDLRHRIAVDGRCGDAVHARPFAEVR